MRREGVRPAATEDRSDCPNRTRELWRAGPIPAPNTAIMEAHDIPKTTRQLHCGATTYRPNAGGTVDDSICVPHQANTRPSAKPARANNEVSAITCWMIVRREA